MDTFERESIVEHLRSSWTAEDLAALWREVPQEMRAALSRIAHGTPAPTPIHTAFPPVGAMLPWTEEEVAARTQSEDGSIPHPLVAYARWLQEHHKPDMLIRDQEHHTYWLPPFVAAWILRQREETHAQGQF